MSPKALPRRRFLTQTAFGGTAIGLGATVPHCFLQAAESSKGKGDRVLVVVELSGGNDGLNTVIPYRDELYYSARPELAIQRKEVLAIDDDFGLHPSMRGARDLLDDGMFSVIHAVGYDNPNRSHFESMDIWHSCARKDEPRQSGWLGRFLDERRSAGGGDVPAIHLGNQQQPFALTARSVRVPTVKKLEEFQLRGSDTNALRSLLLEDAPTLDRSSENELLTFLRSSTQNAVTASQRVTEATTAYQTDVDYPEARLSQELKVVAQLISSGMKTQVYYVRLDGFDTHAQQPDTHSVLLRQWSDAISAFMRDMKSKGNHENICVLTFSEFGRRVAENASAGTDHGAAGPVFLCGGAVQAGLIGRPASLSDLQQGDLKHFIDFRQVYASLLRDWLNCDEKDVLGRNYPTIDLFS